MIRQLIAGIGLGVIASAGCFSLSDLDPFPCATDKSCPTDYVCISNRCYARTKVDWVCSKDSGCPSGQTCLAAGACALQDKSCPSSLRWESNLRVAKKDVPFGECVGDDDVERIDGAKWCNTYWSFYDDRANCGSCAHACESNEVCSGSTCTACSKTVCGESCTDLQTDSKNCGECGKACPTGSTCQAGTCQCSAPNTMCSNVCRNLTDWSRKDVITSSAGSTTPCGTCSTFCSFGQYCVGGRCATCESFGSGWRACSASTYGSDWVCVDSLNSSAHCGRCGWYCNSGYVCRNGVCSR